MSFVTALYAQSIATDDFTTTRAADTATPTLKAETHSAPDSTNQPVLDTMTVVGRRSLGKDETAHPTTVTGEEVRETSRATPLEALSQSSSDIYVTSRGTGLHGISSGASGGIYIRGLGGSPNSQILVVEDGAPDYQGIFGHPIPDAFFPSLIDKVVVIKGGDGVLYGTNAMGGAIVVESRWPDTAGMRLENDAAYGSFNTFRDRATLLYKSKGFDAVTALSAFSTSGHRDGAGGNSQAGQAGLRFRLSPNASLTLRDKFVHLEGADPGSEKHPHPDNCFDVMRNTLNLRLDVFTSGVRFQAIPWLNAGEHRLFDGFFSRDYVGGCIVEMSGSLFDNRLSLLGGIAGDRIQGTVTDRTPDSAYVAPVIAPVNGVAPYCQATLAPIQGLTVVVGGRLHFSSKYRGRNVFSDNPADTLPFEPLYKAGLTYKPFTWGGFHARVTRNFRQPTLRELYLPFPVANPGLKPEHSLNADAGLDFTPGAMSFSLSAYRTYARDLIKYFGMWPSAEVINIDEINIPGCEVEWHVPFGDFLKFSGSACWQDVGRFTKQNPDAKANAGLAYSGRLKNGTLELSLSGEWVHGLYMNNYKADTLRMEDVRFVDGSVRFKTRTVKGLEIEPYCIIRNLFDVQYEYIVDYPMPGINVLAGITMKM